MAPRWCVSVAHKWRFPKVMYVLFVIEIPLTIAALALFGIADPDTYRTKLWQNGSDQGFNSNPIEILYAYANYRPIKVPLIWSNFTTQFNVVVSVLSMFIMLVKTIMFVLHAWVPLLSVFVHAILIVIYAIALRNQASPDLSDTSVPRLSKNLPWYLEKGCSYATAQNHGYCMQARAAFAVTCVLLALFCVYFGWSIFNSIITKAEKEERLTDYNEDIELKNARYAMDEDAGLSKEERWEKNRQIFLNLPKTPNTPGFGARNPMTPRTTAFTQLSGGESTGSGPSKPLAFRQQYGQQGVPDAR